MKKIKVKNKKIKGKLYFFFLEEEREEEPRLDERLTLEREEELFELRDELLLEKEILLLREEEEDLEEEERSLEDEYVFLEVCRLTEALALGALERTERVAEELLLFLEEGTLDLK